MATGLLIDCDQAVAAYIFSKYNQPVYGFDRAIGLLNTKGELVGAVLFHNWNGFNVEISYYGTRTMTPGIVRCLARFVLLRFDPTRLSATVSKLNKPFIRSLNRLGFKIEGAQRCYYGRRDCNRNTGVRLVMFRERIDELAKTPMKKAN